MVALAVHHGEPGTEGMELLPAWRDALEAGDELRELYVAVPNEILARWAVETHEVEEREEDEPGRVTADEAGDYGITDAPLWAAVGPDADEIPPEEAERRLRETLADLYYEDRGYEIQKHVNRLTNERNRDA